MKAVIKERLDSLVDARPPGAAAGHRSSTRRWRRSPTRTASCCGCAIPPKPDAALAALRPLITRRGADRHAGIRRSTSSPDGTITLTLSPVALNARARGAVQQSIEIVRRRIDETGVVDPQITQQGDNRIVVQLPGIEDPNRIKELLGKTAHMTFQLVDETANANAGGAAAAGRGLPADAGQPEREDRGAQAGRRGRRRPDRRARRHQPADRRVGGQLHLQLRRRAPLRRHHAAPTSTTASPSCWTTR